MQLGLLHQLRGPSLSCIEKQCLPEENTLYTPPSSAIHKENGHHTFQPKEMRETLLIITSLQDGSHAIHSAILPQDNYLRFQLSRLQVLSLLHFAAN